MRAALGYAAYAVESHRKEESDRNERIERAAEACMVSRGYAIRPR